MPLGESRVHVADRIKGVFGTILRDASPERSNPVGSFIIVSHGVTIRCFRMRWMHYPWKWHEREKNPQLLDSTDRGDRDTATGTSFSIRAGQTIAPGATRGRSPGLNWSTTSPGPRRLSYDWHFLT
jgi:Histidine phosphatase superfamily (branch 1)